MPSDNTKAFFLTAEDRRLIQDFLTLTRNLRINTPPTSREDWDELQASDSYIALTPSTGIAALTNQTAGVSGVGDMPGSAVCNIYRVVNGTLQTLPTGLTKKIYNFSATAISGNTWIQVEKDKFGTWMALSSSSSGGGTLVIRFRISAIIAPYVALCFVHAVPAGMTVNQMPGLSASILPGASSVIVCDPQCSFFNEPQNNMINRLGWAAYMLPLIPNNCQPSGYYLEPQWEVFSLGCNVNPSCGN